MSTDLAYSSFGLQLKINIFCNNGIVYIYGDEMCYVRALLLGTSKSATTIMLSRLFSPLGVLYTSVPTPLWVYLFRSALSLSPSVYVPISSSLIPSCFSLDLTFLYASNERSTATGLLFF